jgi:hypothetical protein
MGGAVTVLMTGRGVGQSWPVDREGGFGCWGRMATRGEWPGAGVCGGKLGKKRLWEQ